MRLLSRSSNNGNFQLTSFDDDAVPPYAILSHTWIEGQEVTYHDLVAGRGKEKSGYTKIQFCVDKAAEDGVHYSWVDTCCIDKSTSDELSTAINSMFRWYQRVVKCYVFLSDVQVLRKVTDAQVDCKIWTSAFQDSRWFRRGWTLQELLAPSIVEFFSKDGTQLGSKVTLEQEIHQITRIPVAALRGEKPLSEFSIDERISWATHRTTSRKEDKAYCLLGILGVFLPLIHGEGEEHALQRLREEAVKRQPNQEALGLQEATGSSSLLYHVNKLPPSNFTRESRIRASDVAIANTNCISNSAATQEIDGTMLHDCVACTNSCSTDNIVSLDETENRDLGQGSEICYPTALTREVPTCITNSRDSFIAGRSEVHEKVRSTNFDPEAALRYTNHVPYELGGYGIHLQSHAHILQTATHNKNTSPIKGPFPVPPRPWSLAETQRLTLLTSTRSELDWGNIAKKFPNRTERACKNRYDRLKDSEPPAKQARLKARSKAI